MTEENIQRALETAPKSFKLYDVLGNETHNFAGQNVYYTPGSTALNILDHKTGDMRKANTADFVDFSKVISQLEYIASTSTAFITSDVCEKISDSYRLFLSLLYCEKPVVTGAFTIESFNIMKDFQLAVRGTEEALKEKPLTVVCHGFLGYLFCDKYIEASGTLKCRSTSGVEEAATVC